MIHCFPEYRRLNRVFWFALVRMDTSAKNATSLCLGALCETASLALGVLVAKSTPQSSRTPWPNAFPRPGGHPDKVETSSGQFTDNLRTIYGQFPVKNLRKRTMLLCSGFFPGLSLDCPWIAPRLSLSCPLVARPCSRLFLFCFLGAGSVVFWV